MAWLQTQSEFVVAGFGVLWRVLGMPDYEYEALDSSGKLVTGSLVCSDKRQALEKLTEFGLHPTKLALKQETHQAPASKFWDGTFGDAFQWFCWGVCMPLLGLFLGLNSPEKAHPAMGIIVTGLISLIYITKRVLTGKWPEAVGGGG